MNREDKINEGQVQLNDRNNYRPLDQPMVVNTAIKVSTLIKSMLQEDYIDEMTAKWCFTHQQRFTNRRLLGDQ